MIAVESNACTILRKYEREMDSVVLLLDTCCIDFQAFVENSHHSRDHQDLVGA